MQTLEIEILLGILSFIITTLLGLMVYFKNRQSWTNRLFFILSFFIDLYIIVNFISLHPFSSTPASQLFWIRIVMFVTSFIGPTLVLLVHTFPQERIQMERKYWIPLFSLMMFSTSASLTPLVFSAITYPKGNPVPVPGPGIVLFIADFVGLFLLSFGILIYKYRKSSGTDKLRFLYLFLGILFSFSLMGIFTVIFVVILKTSAFVFLGPIFPVILMAFIAYTIVKLSLFDIRVAATQVLVAIIWIILFSKIIVSPTLGERLVDIAVFITMIVFGYLLVKSVLREIKQRERLQKVTNELEAANMALKTLDQAKSEFISIASHQLRSPLTVIKGYISMIREGTIDPDSRQGKEALERVALSTEQLIKLIANMLDLSRIEGGRIKYEFSPHNFIHLIEGIIKEFHPHAKEKNVTFHFENDAKTLDPFSFDADKMRDVVINLIDNAIKYAKEGHGQVTVRLEYAGKNQDRVRLSIRDNGIGIKMEDIPRLFNKFIRSDEAQKVDPGGMGIGIYFVKRVVEDHGGKVGVESEGIGKGSTFFFELPIR